MALSKRLRYEVLRRDNYACRYCGATAPDTKLTVDHVTPTALGGTDDPTNLATACADCNSGKSATPADSALVADVATDALRWAAAMRRAADLEAAQRERLDAAAAHVDEAWKRYQCHDGDVPRPLGWRDSVRQLTEAGLTADDITRAIDTAMANTRIDLASVWRYTCGICWRTLESRQQTARQLIAAEEAADGA